MIQTRRRPTRFAELSDLDRMVDHMHRNPTDEAHRLMLADKFEEEGKPAHAELLRTDKHPFYWKTTFVKVRPQSIVRFYPNESGSLKTVSLMYASPDTHLEFHKDYDSEQEAAKVGLKLFREGAKAAEDPWTTKQLRQESERQKRQAEPMQRQTSFAMPNRIVEVPLHTQTENYGCWANAVASVLQLFGYDEGNVERLKKKLGTTRANSTNPMLVAGFLNMIGLKAVARNGMTVKDLDRFTSAGCPVIVGVQDYMEAGHIKHDKEYGHCLLVLGVLAPRLSTIEPKLLSLAKEFLNQRKHPI